MRVLPIAVVVATLGVAPLVAPGAAAAAPAAAPGITLLNVTGSGCKPKTTSAALSLDRTAITVIYSTYSAVSRGSTKAVSADCRINMKIGEVTGYAPTITSVDYRGFAELAAGSVAQLAATYGFHGATHVESVTKRLAGPYSDYWAATDAAEGGLVSGNCKGSNVVDLDSTLTLTSSAAGDVVAMDSTDGVVPNTLHVTWKPCS